MQDGGAVIKGNVEVEFRALAEDALDADAAVVGANDLAGDGKAEARAGALGARDAVEFLE